MKNQNVIFNGYKPFYNNSNSSIIDQKYWEIYKDNTKQSQSINLFKKNYRSKIPILNQRHQGRKFEPNKNSRNESQEGNLLSCPNIKNNIFFKKLTNNTNSLYNKLYENKNNNQILSPLKNINLDLYNSKINTDNYEYKKREREREFEKIKYFMKQKGDKTFHNSLSKNINNNTLNNDRLSNCFTVFSIKAQPILNQKRTNKTIDNKNKLSNKFSLKNRENKIPSLPKMNNSNNFNKKNRDFNPIISKSLFSLKDKKSKTNIEEMKAFLHPIEKKKNKFKNLVSFDVFSLPGIEKGKQKINQDSYLVLPNINNTSNCKIFGVFDGHGDNSDILSQEIRDYFIEYFSDNNIYNQKNALFNNNLDIMNKISKDENLQKVYNLYTKNNYSEINKIFESINDKLHNRYKDNNFCLKSGSTSNIVIVMNDKKKDCLNKIISINLGDSKSLLINEDNQAIDLNIVHNPEDSNERERIERNGGEISRVDWADYGPLRVFYKGKHYPGLAMTRAFGDFNAESLGINTIPDIREYDIDDKKPKIIILASDGVWQFLSNEKVKNIVLPYYEEDNISGAAQKLVNSALRMWETKNPNFIDDITVIILFFR